MQMCDLFPRPQVIPIVLPQDDHVARIIQNMNPVVSFVYDPKLPSCRAEAVVCGAFQTKHGCRASYACSLPGFTTTNDDSMVRNGSKDLRLIVLSDMCNGLVVKKSWYHGKCS